MTYASTKIDWEQLIKNIARTQEDSILIPFTPRSREEAEVQQNNDFIVDDCSPEQRAYEQSLPEPKEQEDVPF